MLMKKAKKANVRGPLVLAAILLLLLSYSSLTISLAIAQGTIEISNLKIEPTEVKVGEEVTVTADVTNMGNVTSYEVILMINGKREDSQNLTLESNETRSIKFTYTSTQVGSYNVAIGDESAQFNAIPLSEAKFRVGPVVKLRPVNDIISSSRDGLVELFFSNPGLNDGIVLSAEVWVSVPAGIHVYGEGFGTTTAAGTVYGQFNSSPGTSRTIYVNVKADETTVGKTYFIHLIGLYYPNDNKDACQPFSLTHPFEVLEASPNPNDPTPPTNDQISSNTPQTGGISIEWAGLTPWIILAIAVVAIALIALARR